MYNHLVDGIHPKELYIVRIASEIDLLAMSVDNILHSVVTTLFAEFATTSSNID